MGNECFIAVEPQWGAIDHFLRMAQRAIFIHPQHFSIHPIKIGMFPKFVYDASHRPGRHNIIGADEANDLALGSIQAFIHRRILAAIFAAPPMQVWILFQYSNSCTIIIRTIIYDQMFDMRILLSSNTLY